MAEEIIGLAAIGKALGVSATTAQKLRLEAGLFCYRKRLQKVRPGARGWAWTTTPTLLAAWQIARCAVDRQATRGAPAGATDPRRRVAGSRA